MSAAYRHDGSLPGFLCAVADVLNDEIAGVKASLTLEPDETPELFDDVIDVPRDDRRARKLFSRLVERAGHEALEAVFDAFRSDRKGVSKACARALCRMRLEGRSCLDDLADPDIAAVEAASRRTRAILHRFQGITRFSELADGVFFAPVAPECDVLAPLARHFASRFPAMSWAIMDTRRGSAFIHEPSIGLVPATGLQMGAESAEGDAGGFPPLSEREASIRERWRRYFGSVAIRERSDASLQRSHLPLKYRAFLPEFDEPLGFRRLPPPRGTSERMPVKKA